MNPLHDQSISKVNQFAELHRRMLEFSSNFDLKFSILIKYLDCLLNRFDDFVRSKTSNMDIIECNSTVENELTLDFVTACEKGDITVVNDYIRKGICKNPDTKDSCYDGFFSACKNGHSGVIDVLLTNGFDKHSLLLDANSHPVLSCIQNGNSIMAKKIIFAMEIASSDPDSLNDIHGRSLICAIKSYNSAMIDYLIRKDNINVNFQNEDGDTALNIASNMDFKDAILAVLGRADVDPNIYNDKGISPLVYATINESKHTVRSLLRNSQTDTNIKTSIGKTPLHIAVEKDNFEITKLLLEDERTDPNVLNDSGIPPLFIAIDNNLLDIVKLFLKYGKVNPNILSFSGDTPLHVSVSKGMTNMTELFIGDERVDANIKNSSGKTPLFVASENNNHDICKILLSRKETDPNVKDDKSVTSLIHAAECEFVSVLEVLSDDQRILPNEKDADGRTALTIASEKGNFDIVKILLMNPKTDVDLNDDLGRSPVSIASESGYNNIVDYINSKIYIKEREAKYNSISEKKFSVSDSSLSHICDVPTKTKELVLVPNIGSDHIFPAKSYTFSVYSPVEAQVSINDTADIIMGSKKAIPDTSVPCNCSNFGDDSDLRQSQMNSGLPVLENDGSSNKCSSTHESNMHESPEEVVSRDNLHSVPNASVSLDENFDIDNTMPSTPKFSNFASKDNEANPILSGSVVDTPIPTDINKSYPADGQVVAECKLCAGITKLANQTNLNKHTELEHDIAESSGITNGYDTISCDISEVSSFSNKSVEYDLMFSETNPDSSVQMTDDSKKSDINTTEFCNNTSIRIDDTPSQINPSVCDVNHSAFLQTDHKGSSNENSEPHNHSGVCNSKSKLVVSIHEKSEISINYDLIEPKLDISEIVDRNVEQTTAILGFSDTCDFTNLESKPTLGIMELGNASVNIPKSTQSLDCDNKPDKRKLCLGSTDHANVSVFLPDDKYSSKIIGNYGEIPSQSKDDQPDLSKANHTLQADISSSSPVSLSDSTRIFKNTKMNNIMKFVPPASQIVPESPQTDIKLRQRSSPNNARGEILEFGAFHKTSHSKAKGEKSESKSSQGKSPNWTRKEGFDSKSSDESSTSKANSKETKSSHANLSGKKEEAIFISKLSEQSRLKSPRVSSSGVTKEEKSESSLIQKVLSSKLKEEKSKSNLTHKTSPNKEKEGKVVSCKRKDEDSKHNLSQMNSPGKTKEEKTIINSSRVNLQNKTKEEKQESRLSQKDSLDRVQEEKSRSNTLHMTSPNKEKEERPRTSIARTVSPKKISKERNKFNSSCKISPNIEAKGTSKNDSVFQTSPYRTRQNSELYNDAIKKSSNPLESVNSSAFIKGSNNNSASDCEKDLTTTDSNEADMDTSFVIERIKEMSGILPSNTISSHNKVSHSDRSQCYSRDHSLIDDGPSRRRQSKSLTRLSPNKGKIKGQDVVDIYPELESNSHIIEKLKGIVHSSAQGKYMTFDNTTDESSTKRGSNKANLNNKHDISDTCDSCNGDKQKHSISTARKNINESHNTSNSGLSNYSKTCKLIPPSLDNINISKRLKLSGPASQDDAKNQQKVLFERASLGSDENGKSVSDNYSVQTNVNLQPDIVTSVDENALQMSCSTGSGENAQKKIKQQIANGPNSSSDSERNQSMRDINSGDSQTYSYIETLDYEEFRSSDGKVNNIGEGIIVSEKNGVDMVQSNEVIKEGVAEFMHGDNPKSKQCVPVKKSPKATGESKTDFVTSDKSSNFASSEIYEFSSSKFDSGTHVDPHYSEFYFPKRDILSGKSVSVKFQDQGETSEKEEEITIYSTDSEFDISPHVRTVEDDFETSSTGSSKKGFSSSRKYTKISDPIVKKPVSKKIKRRSDVDSSKEDINKEGYTLISRDSSFISENSSGIPATSDQNTEIPQSGERLRLENKSLAELIDIANKEDTTSTDKDDSSLECIGFDSLYDSMSTTLSTLSYSVSKSTQGDLLDYDSQTDNYNIDSVSQVETICPEKPTNVFIYESQSDSVTMKSDSREFLDEGDKDVNDNKKEDSIRSVNREREFLTQGKSNDGLSTLPKSNHYELNNTTSERDHNEANSTRSQNTGPLETRGLAPAELHTGQVDNKKFMPKAPAERKGTLSVDIDTMEQTPLTIAVSENDTEQVQRIVREKIPDKNLIPIVQYLIEFASYSPKVNEITKIICAHFKNKAIYSHLYRCNYDGTFLNIFSLAAQNRSNPKAFRTVIDCAISLNVPYVKRRLIVPFNSQHIPLYYSILRGGDESCREMFACMKDVFGRDEYVKNISDLISQEISINLKRFQTYDNLVFACVLNNKFDIATELIDSFGQLAWVHEKNLDLLVHIVIRKFEETSNKTLIYILERFFNSAIYNHFLIESKDVYFVNKSSYSLLPLQAAVIFKQEEVVKAFINANVDLRDVYSQPTLYVHPLNIAREVISTHPTIYTLLENSIRERHEDADKIIQLICAERFDDHKELLLALQ